MKSQLQRANGHSHSHDSAIDSDLQEWETEAIDLDMAGNVTRLSTIVEIFKILIQNFY